MGLALPDSFSQLLALTWQEEEEDHMRAILPCGAAGAISR